MKALETFQRRGNLYAKAHTAGRSYSFSHEKDRDANEERVWDACELAVKTEDRIEAKILLLDCVLGCRSFCLRIDRITYLHS